MHDEDMNEINETTSLPGNEVPPRPQNEEARPSPTPPTGYNNPFTASGRVLERKNGMLSGVSGGLADFFGLDATLVRLILVALTVLAGPVIPVAYLVAWIIIPQAQDANHMSGASSGPPPPAPTVAG